MRRTGATLTGLLVSVAVILAAAITLFALWQSVHGESDQATDARNMRQIYVGLSLYEQENDHWPAPRIDLVTRFVDGPEIFRATNDPAHAGPYPIDPSLPKSAGKSSFQISYGYLGTWLGSGQAKLPKSWALTQRDPQQGLIADWWFGDQTGKLPNGPVIRVNVDGSVTKLSKRQDADRLTYADLFRNRD